MRDGDVADMVKTRVLWLAFAGALSLAGCPGAHVAGACVRNSDCEAGEYCSGGTCTHDCTAATVADDCAPGQSCTSFGMCVGAPDAGPRDAGPPPADVGTDAFDPRPSCVIAGGTDADGDEFCAGSGTADDCEDSIAAVHPGAAEVCSPQDGPSSARGLDDDCDGAIDEGCEWYFAQPHPLTALHMSSRAHFTPNLTADGLRLYFVHYDSSAPGLSRIHVAERAGLDEPFGAPTVVEADLTGLTIASISLSEDELEVFCQIRDGAEPQQHLYRATRTDRAAPFSRPVRMAATTTLLNSYHPHLSRDGHELFFATDDTGARVIRRLLRTDVDADFTGPTEVITLPTGAGDWLFPTLSPDRLTAFYSVGSQLFRASRSAPSESTFTDPVDIADLNVPGAFSISVFVSEPTGEIFFDGAGRPYSPTAPGTDSLFRARLCRDAACAPIRVDCDIATGAVRSADQLHCFWMVTTPQTWGNAFSSCGAGHLVTIHSAAEYALAGSVIGGERVWLGAYDGTPGITSLPPVPQCTTSVPGCGFAWVTGEPWIFSAWGPGEPNNALAGEDVAEMSATRWNDASASDPLRAACEEELWPTW
jgi:hypothetical protein